MYLFKLVSLGPSLVLPKYPLLFLGRTMRGTKTLPLLGREKKTLGGVKAVGGPTTYRPDTRKEMYVRDITSSQTHSRNLYRFSGEKAHCLDCEGYEMNDDIFNLRQSEWKELDEIKEREGYSENWLRRFNEFYALLKEEMNKPQKRRYGGGSEYNDERWPVNADEQLHRYQATIEAENTRRGYGS